MMMNEFLDELKRLLAFYQKPDKAKQPDEHKDYEIWLEEIFKKVSWIETLKFRLVIDALLDVRPRFRKDLDHRKIVAIYNELAERNGWKQNAEKRCNSCNGIRFVYIWLRDKKGNEFEATKGCGACNQKLSNVHPDFTEIPRPDRPPVDTRAQIRKIPSFMAQCLLNIADASRINLREDTFNDLIEAAAQPGLKTYSPGKYDESQRKNALVRALCEAPPPPPVVAEAGTVEEEPAKTEPPPVPTEQPSPAAATYVVEMEPPPPAARRKTPAGKEKAEGLPLF